MQRSPTRPPEKFVSPADGCQLSVISTAHYSEASSSCQKPHLLRASFRILIHGLQSSCANGTDCHCAQGSSIRISLCTAITSSLLEYRSLSSASENPQTHKQIPDGGRSTRSTGQRLRPCPVQTGVHCGLPTAQCTQAMGGTNLKPS